ncbi:unnamed protein product [Nyctereutes procyonoides]|uniref:(raccoon dog) hypothetical protein n=1 Tax=Nyctereutes procyonoides TaxID=34880 RepID=A0A811Y3H2_NYCPR|nr:unnamed protein product [Nyctereutes procyonoides]
MALEREAETQAEGETGSMQGARCGTRSQDPRTAPRAKGRPEVQNQGVGKPALPLMALWETPSLPSPASGRSRSFLVCGHITALSVSIFMRPSLCVPVPSLFFSYKENCHWI